jgi:hypothetical protein
LAAVAWVIWTQLLANNEVQQHNTSKKELDKLQAVIRRDLADASRCRRQTLEQCPTSVCYRVYSVKECLCAGMSALPSRGPLRVVFSDAGENDRFTVWELRYKC